MTARHPLLVLADEILAARQREPEISTDTSCLKCGALPDEPCWNATVEGGICVRRSA